MDQSLDGVQTVIHQLQESLEKFRNFRHVLLAIDFVNAFNARDRSRIAELLFSRPEWAKVHRLFNFIYKTTSDLHLPDGRIIKSRNGLLQGEVLASYAYSLSVDHVYTQVAASGSPNNTSKAILDDLNIVDSFDEIKKCWSTLTRLCAEEGIEISKSKTKILWPFSASDHDNPMPEEVVTWCNEQGLAAPMIGAMPMLGGAVGLDEAKRAAITLEKVDSMEQKSYSLFRSETVPIQTLLHLLRLSGVSLLSHLPRHLTPLLLVPTS